MQAEPVQKVRRRPLHHDEGLGWKEANDIFDKLESVFSWTLLDLGAAKVDPATLESRA
jgi:hypothetical protein